MWVLIEVSWVIFLNQSFSVFFPKDSHVPYSAIISELNGVSDL